jgi:hypothetical protein
MDQRRQFQQSGNRVSERRRESFVDLDHYQFSPISRSRGVSHLQVVPRSQVPLNPRAARRNQPGEGRQSGASRRSGRSDRWSRGARREPSPPEAVSLFSSLPLPEPSRMCSNPLWACFVTGARLIWGCFNWFALGFDGRVVSAVAALRFRSRGRVRVGGMVALLFVLRFSSGRA